MRQNTGNFTDFGISQMLPSRDFSSHCQWLRGVFPCPCEREFSRPDDGNFRLEDFPTAAKFAAHLKPPATRAVPVIEPRSADF